MRFTQITDAQREALHILDKHPLESLPSLYESEALTRIMRSVRSLQRRGHVDPSGTITEACRNAMRGSRGF